jgi:hypothetical protein
LPEPILASVPVMIALTITKKFDLLYAMIERVLYDFHTREPNDMFYALLAKFQNTLPYVFTLYAGFKLGKVEPREVVESIQPVVSQYGSAYDDFLFVIMLNWFLSDCFAAMGDHEKCRIHHNAAFELSKFADYRFLMASLLINKLDGCNSLREVRLYMTE